MNSRWPPCTKTLKTRIIEDMKSALGKGDKPRRGIVRPTLVAIKQREVDGRVELDNQQILGVLDKMVKQRRDSWNNTQMRAEMNWLIRNNLNLM